MFLHTDPEYQLDLYRQRSAEWRRAAAADHLAHQVAGGGAHRFRWRWPARRTHAVRAPVAS
jgi:hypothetical protein